ncbi:gliding motility protein [Streptomyces sp. SID10853]|uniref:gliding motility protein n=1 Tax=Streptomyces sp. SID10853 TaxID=2706028 RepID=UPI0031BACC4A
MEPAVEAGTEAPGQEPAGEPVEAPAPEPAPENLADEPVPGAPAEDAAAGTVESVEIPRQQSASAAADNEAGEGVRK